MGWYNDKYDWLFPGGNERGCNYNIIEMAIEALVMKNL